MATITTDTYLDGGTARTAGESWTCNGGKLTVRTDTRWHANSPASMTGSLGGITVSSSLGGGVLIDGRNVRWMAYNTGTGNVPAIGTTVSQGGVSGYLLGVWADLTSAPTAVGAAMPTTGFLKFREVTGGTFSSGALTGIGASSTGADKTGWIEVVGDQAMAVTVSRKGSGFVTRGDWFYLDDTNGSIGQVLQVPTNGGGSTTHCPGAWIETSPGSDEYAYWSALPTNNGWYYYQIGECTNVTEDPRRNYLKSLGSGQLQIGESYESGALTYAVTASSATYTWASNVVTVTSTGHGFYVGQQVHLDFTSGGATADGVYTVTTVPSTSTYTVALTGSGTSGNVTARGKLVISGFTSHNIAVGTTLSVNVTTGGLTSGHYKVYDAPTTSQVTINFPASTTITGDCTVRMTIGAVPQSGCKVRIPNVFYRQCTTAARATNTVPNGTLGTRPDFVTTGAGAIDIDYMYGDWYLNFSQPYSVSIKNSSTWDVVSIAECATKVVLENGGNSNYISNTTTLSFTSCFAGADVTDWVACRSAAVSNNTHNTQVVTSSGGFNFLRTIFNTTQRTCRSTSTFGLHISQSQEVVVEGCVFVGMGFGATTAKNVLLTDCISADSTNGESGITTSYFAYLATKCSDITIQNLTFGYGPVVRRAVSYTNVMNVTACSDIILRNIGTRDAMVIDTSNGFGVPATVWLSGGNNSNITVKRCYFGMLRTGPSTTVNSDKNILEEHVYGMYAGTGMASAHTPSALNQRTRGIGSGSNSVAANASVYGTHIYDLFTSDTTGRVVCVMNEETAETASQTTIVAGTPQFTSTPSLSNPSVNDEAIIEMDYFALGHTGFQNTAPTLTGTNTGNMAFTYQIDLGDGNGYNGTWLTLNGTNLSSHTVDPAVGFKMKFRVVTTAANTTNAITHISVNTTSTLTAQTNNLYPLETIDAQLYMYGLKDGTEVRVYRASDDTELAGVESLTGTEFTYDYTWTGTDTEVFIVVYALGWLPVRYEGIVLSSNGVSIPVQQSQDRQYLNP